MPRLNTYQKRLAFRMEQLGVSIQQLAADIGKTPSAVHAWVREGSKRKPKIASRRRIAEVLHCDPDWLLSGHGAEPLPPSSIPDDPPGQREEDIGSDGRRRPLSMTVDEARALYLAAVCKATGATSEEVTITVRIEHGLSQVQRAYAAEHAAGVAAMRRSATP